MNDKKIQEPSLENQANLHTQLEVAASSLLSRAKGLSLVMKSYGVSAVPSGFFLSRTKEHVAGTSVNYTDCVLFASSDTDSLARIELHGKKESSTPGDYVKVTTHFFQTVDGGYRVTYSEDDPRFLYNLRCPVLHVYPNGDIDSHYYIGLREVALADSECALILTDIISALGEFDDPNFQS